MRQDILLRALRSRLRSIEKQMAEMQAEQPTATDMRKLFNDGWIGASEVEAAFLFHLISKIEREGVTP